MPDIGPMRMGALDVGSLAPLEVYAILVKLAGHEDPVVAAAVVDVTRAVLARTRGGG